MANKSLSDLTAAALQLSNYEDSGFVQTPELTARCQEAVSAYYDLVLGSRETYFRAPFVFSLAGGYGGNTVALPADLYKVQFLDRNPGTSSVEPVPTLPSERERNTVGKRCYDWIPGELTIFPPQTSNGNYQLTYTPYCPTLINPTVVISDAPAPSTIPVFNFIDNVQAGTKTWTFANADFGISLIGATLTVAGASHSGNNGTFVISAVLNSQTLVTATASTLVNETFNGATASYQALADHVTAASQRWNFQAAAFDSSYVGGVLTVAGLPSSTNNGTFPITAVLTPTTIVTAGATLTDEVFGTTGAFASIAVQAVPVGAVTTLPNTMQSGALWIELFMAIGILDKAEQDSSALQTRLALQTKRIQDALRWKQDEPKQIPLVRGRHSGLRRWGW